MKCSNCQMEVGKNMRFCPGCGSEVHRPEKFKFACPACQQRISVPVEWGGQKAFCPGCGAKIMIPEADEAPELPPRKNGKTPKLMKIEKLAEPARRPKKEDIPELQPKKVSVPPPQGKLAEPVDIADVEAEKSSPVIRILLWIILILLIGCCAGGVFFFFRQGFFTESSKPASVEVIR